MILFLRNKKNDTILDVECFVEEGHVELHSTVCIEPYSELLLAQPEEKQVETMIDFGKLQELRGWLWEMYFGGRQNTADQYDEILKILRTYLKEVADKYDIAYVED
jgi:hypothetical protein